MPKTRKKAAPKPKTLTRLFNNFLGGYIPGFPIATKERTIPRNDATLQINIINMKIYIFHPLIPKKTQFYLSTQITRFISCILGK